jgi:hypothetical protein
MSKKSDEEAASLQACRDYIEGRAVAMAIVDHGANWNRRWLGSRYDARDLPSVVSYRLGAKVIELNSAAWRKVRMI